MKCQKLRWADEARCNMLAFRSVSTEKVPSIRTNCGAAPATSKGAALVSIFKRVKANRPESYATIGQVSILRGVQSTYQVPWLRSAPASRSPCRNSRCSSACPSRTALGFNEDEPHCRNCADNKSSFLLVTVSFTQIKGFGKL